MATVKDVSLGTKTAALVQLGVSVASGSLAICLEWSTARKAAAGAMRDEITDVLLAVAQMTGLGRAIYHSCVVRRAFVGRVFRRPY